VGLSHEGGGIGLSLAKNLVELHGGTITAHSQGPDIGSEFVVKLPVVSRVQSKREHTPEAIQLEASELLPRRRILIVDDNVQAADSLGGGRIIPPGGHPARPRNDRDGWLRGGDPVARALGVLQGTDRGRDRLGAPGGSPSISGDGLRPASGQASYGERLESHAHRSRAEAPRALASRTRAGSCSPRKCRLHRGDWRPTAGACSADRQYYHTPGSSRNRT